MANTSYTSIKTSYNNAELFKNSFYSSTLGYTFLGKHLAWSNESTPDTIIDTVSSEKYLWDNMYAGKKITGNDVELVAPRIDWTGNTKYRQYDDTIHLTDLLTANASQNLNPMYVITTDRNVYLCLSNNASANSTVQPTGQNLSANGNITTLDGYVWKYLYNILPSNKFTTNTWIPVPTSSAKLDYSMSDVITVDGELTTVAVTNAGTGYIHSTITVSAFSNSCTVLTVSNTNNIAANMSISGTGIAPETYISSVDTVYNQITISTATIDLGGGSSNGLAISTRVYFDGDGTSASGIVNLSGNTVGSITVTSGKGFSRCNVYLYGTGTNANARAILSPKFGHGKNPAKELGATNVMISSKIGAVDSTEGGLISSNTTFRQYGILINPYKYGDSVAETIANANSAISQTTNISLIAGTSYNLDEFVYQGTNANTATFSGYVNAQDTNTVRLTNVIGTISIGAPLKGITTNPTGRVVVTKTNPELQPYTGDIIYAENITKKQRTDGQAENLKFVIRF
jgi:hypothetical protein